MIKTICSIKLVCQAPSFSAKEQHGVKELGLFVGLVQPRSDMKPHCIVE